MTERRAHADGVAAGAAAADARRTEAVRTGVVDPLASFAVPTRDWFTGAFAAPTAAQTGTWAAVQGGDHALVVAPTGSGKTLAAFLWALDGLLARGGDVPAAAERCRVVYVSPLKALAADVERNLRSPLVGIRQAALRRGAILPEVRIGVRTGDTPPHERRSLATSPPDILITTPESLYLILTSAARQGLAGVHTVIVDEIHAVAGTKRGAHLAVSLERLDALLGRPAQRIGLSATVRPADAVARFLVGGRSEADGARPVTIVSPPSAKQVVVDVVVPVPDLADVASAPTARRGGDPSTLDEEDLTGPAAAELPRASIWPHVEERVVDLVADHRTTLVFTNSRRGAERLTARMNEVWAERQGVVLPEPGTLVPAQVTAQSGTSIGLDPALPVLARAHHGSMSRSQRTRTESELKSGDLPAVVATSSLELGIDMGAIDLVVQVGAPPSVASGLQRVGRAGHQVGAVSRGVVFPTFRGELIPAAVIGDRMRRGEIEALHVLANPLDVLAQQVVAMVAVDDWTVADLAEVVRRAAPFATLGDATLRAVLDMLAGRYPSEDFGELRARIVWDRATDTLTARPGAQRLAVTSGGTIPDRGLYGVFLSSGASAGPDAAVDGPGTDGPGTDGSARRHRGGKRVGELDEEMVYESRVGDTFTLGSSTWRIDEITPDQVLVSPAPGAPGRLPFWKGDSPGRPAELGRAIGAWIREIEHPLPGGAPAPEVLADIGLDRWASENLLAYLHEQREATGRVPDDRTIVVETFPDEIGDWRVVIHSPYGARVHGPWALVIAGRLRASGADVAAMPADDGIVLRLPDTYTADRPGTDLRDGLAEHGPTLSLDDLLIDPDEVADAVRAELAGSALFGARFREAASRALLLPRRRPDRRQPLWQQRHRSAQLLGVAADHPDFPILLEAARECLQDDFDVAALADLMRDLAGGLVRMVQVTTTSPSPFAQSLLFGYMAQFLYDGDAPLAERRAAALTLDPTLLAELLGHGAGSQLAELLDPEVIERTERELGALTRERQARDAEAVADLVRRHGPLTTGDVEARTREDVRDRTTRWLEDLESARRVIRVRFATDRTSAAGGGRASEHWAAVEDAGRLRDALGVALPVGISEAFTEVVRDPLGDLLRRHARTRGPFTAASAAARFGLGVAVVTDVLDRLVARGTLVAGRLRPEVIGGIGAEYCDVDVLRTLRRRSLAALRSEVEPVPETTLGVFLPRWHAIGQLGGVDGLARAIEQLSGAVVPASALESLILPARVRDYTPRLLDELTASGAVLWCGHGTTPGGDGLISLHLTVDAALTLPEPPDADQLRTLDSAVHAAVLAALAGGGAYFMAGLVTRAAEIVAAGTPGPGVDGDSRVPSAPDSRAPGGGASGNAGVPVTVDTRTVAAAVWDLVWAGMVTNDSLGPLRAHLGPRAHAPRTARGAPRGARVPARLSFAGRVGSPVLAEHAGRWSLLPSREPDPTVRMHALASRLLARHGVITRAIAPSERLGARFGALYRVLAMSETVGQVRRGYFVEHLGGSQFALPAAVDQLRADARDLDPTGPRTEVVVTLLAATDPANPYGAALPWPAPVVPHEPGDGGGHRPGRKAGAAVVLVAGALALFVERGGRSILSFTDDPDVLRHACERLATEIRSGSLGRVVLTRADGTDLLGPHRPTTRLAAALTDVGFAPTPRGLHLSGQR